MARLPNMIFGLSEQDRALLEAHRVRLGLRSHAETLRVLIRGEPGAAQTRNQLLADANANNMFRNERNIDRNQANNPFVGNQAERVHVDVPILARKTFNPQPKKGKK